jgi:hypothetical protein
LGNFLLLFCCIPLLQCPWFIGLVFWWIHRVLVYSFCNSLVFCPRSLLFFHTYVLYFQALKFCLFQSLGVAFKYWFFLVVLKDFLFPGFLFIFPEAFHIFVILLFHILCCLCFIYLFFIVSLISFWNLLKSTLSSFSSFCVFFSFLSILSWYLLNWFCMFSLSSSSSLLNFLFFYCCAGWEYFVSFTKVLTKFSYRHFWGHLGFIPFAFN